MKSEPVGELCDFISGLWKGEKPPFVRVNVYRNTNFNKDGTLDDSDVAELDVEAKQFAKRKLQYGDIILEKSGGGSKQPVGRVALFDKQSGDYSLSNFTSALRIKNAKNLDFNYLHRFLFWQHLAGVTEGMQKRSTGIRNLNGDAYKAILVPLPPLPEQRRIVGLLDEAFAGIATAKANAEKNLRNARSLFESELEAVFARRASEWAHRRLGDLTDAGTPITYGVVKPGEEGGIRFVRGGDLVRGKVRISELRTITREVSEQYRRTLLRGGELLICLVGQPGQVAVAPAELAGANIARQVGLIRLTPATDAEFVRYHLQSRTGLAALGAKETGSVQQVINLGDLREVSTPHPSLTVQRETVRTLDTLAAQSDRLAALYQQKLTALDALKRSLLHQAFNGRL